MKLRCPECGAEIPAENVSLEGGQALCVRCDRQFPLAELLPEPKAEEALPPPADTKVIVQRQGPARVTLYIPSRPQIWLFGLAAVWNGVTLLLTLVLGIAEWHIAYTLFFGLLLGFLWGMGISFLVDALFSVVGKTLIHVGGGEVAVKKERFGLGRPQRYPLEPESRARLKADIVDGEDKEGEQDASECCITTAGDDVTFGDSLKDDEKSWLVSVINEVLEAGAAPRMAARATRARYGHGKLLPPPGNRIILERLGPGQIRLDIPALPDPGFLSQALGWAVLVVVFAAASWGALNLERTLALIVFGVVGFAFLWRALSTFFGKTRVEVEAAQVTARRLLFGIGRRQQRWPLAAGARAALTKLTDLSDKARVLYLGLASAPKDVPARLCCVSTGTEDLVVGLYLSQDEKSWLVSVINEALGVGEPAGAAEAAGALACPLCGRVLAGALVSADLGVAKCPECDQVYQIPELPVTTEEVEPPPKPAHSNVQVQKEGGKLRLVFPALVNTRGGKRMFGFLAVLGLTWLVALTARTAAKVPSSPLSALILIAVWVATGAVVVKVLRYFLSPLELTLGDGVVEKRRRLLFFQRRVTLPLPSPGSAKRQARDAAGSEALLQEPSFWASLDIWSASPQEKLWLCWLINDFLSTATRVAGESVEREQDPRRPRGSRIVIERSSADHMTVYIPSVRDWFLVGFAAVWNGFMAFLFTPSVARADWPLAGLVFAWLVLAFFWGVGLYFALRALFSLFGKTLVHIGSGEVVVKEQLFGLGRPRRYRLQAGSAARLTEAHEEKVCCIDTGEREIRLGEHLNLSKDEKSWLVALINDVLERQPASSPEEEPEA